MKRLCAVIALTTAALPTWAGTNVGVSVQVNQPGLYGRIDVGAVPIAPVVVYPQPVVIAPSPVAVYQQPIYLHVPPGHQKDWGHHCARYNACGQPVYFVREDWYQQRYVPAQRHDRDGDRGRGRGHDRDHGHGHGHGHDRHDD